MKLHTIYGDKRIKQMQAELGGKAWPVFMQHDAIVEKHWSYLYSDFIEFQYAAFSENNLVGVGNSIPLNWEGDFKDLPARGLDWAMEKAVNDIRNGSIPNLLVGVQILINPELRSRGLSYKFLDFMKSLARNKGVKRIALPVRPTRKHLYPLIPMEDYIHWTNQKGEAFDPWIRVHKKAGGELVSICSQSMTIQGTVREWQNWTGLDFPGSGRYTVDQALCPISIDLGRDLGEYIEPNVWIVHST